jgi:osmotically-inducible protein OsmY
MFPWPSFPEDAQGPLDPDVALALHVIDRLRDERGLRGGRIDVEAQAGVVILTGRVRSAELRGRRARSPGVRPVSVTSATSSTFARGE